MAMRLGERDKLQGWKSQHAPKVYYFQKRIFIRDGGIKG